ncbi:hypothetical protein AFERRI_560048 [Acidithiobacillus ferrivorans]|uniref:Uncharacterized protein n=1 Tax=Acidithiobacillus ferrivorans TaxID=160808 RepID=A0A060UYH3_9PROT|nr:hypothetical protein AFERRI_560048 [Acidithiobacillus ferrivorans]
MSTTMAFMLQEWAFAADFHHHPQGEPPLQGKNQSYQRNPAKSAEVTAEFRIMDEGATDLSMPTP